MSWDSGNSEEPKPPPWTLRNVILLAVVVLVVVIAGSVGGWMLWQASLQPHMQVRDFDASLNSCGWFVTRQSVHVEGFRIANTGPVDGYIDIAITVDERIVRTYTFFVSSGEDRYFYPWDDAMHVFDDDEYIYLQGCDNQVVAYVVGNVWRA